MYRENKYNFKIKYENLDIPEMVIRKHISIDNEYQIYECLKQLAFEIVTLEAYQKGIIDGNK